MTLLSAAFLAMLLAITTPGILPSVTTSGDLGPSEAYFEGRVIDLSVDWEDAQACHIGAEATYCFGSEAELDLWLAIERVVEFAPMACAGSIRLYDHASFGTPMVSIPTHGLWVNLTTYGFNNKTSSYRIGGCDAFFADGASGGAPHLSSSLTTAFTNASTMPSGWNNKVSSVRQD